MPSGDTSWQCTHGPWTCTSPSGHWGPSASTLWLPSGGSFAVWPTELYQTPNEISYAITCQWPCHMDMGYDHAIQALGAPITIEQWGQTVEFAMDYAYRASQLDLKDTTWTSTKPLPRKYRGRCQPNKPIPCPPVLHTKPGRVNDFHPGEVCRRKTRDKIKQVRRLQCLVAKLRKHHPDPVPWDAYKPTWDEWQCVLRSQCMQCDFVQWCQHTPELGPPPYELPSLEYLVTLEQLMRHEATIAQAFDRKCLDKLRIFHHDLDSRWAGHSKAFTRLKDSYVALLVAIQCPEHRDVVVTQDDQVTYDVWCDHPERFTSNQLVHVDPHPCNVIAKDPYSLRVRPLHRDADLIDCQTLHQQVDIQEPAAIFQALKTFWAPYWERDAGEDPDDPHDRMFMDFLAKLPSNLPAPALDVTDVSAWKRALKAMKPTAARGVDGISSWELKQLPDKAAQHISGIMTSYTSGFPAWFMVAITVPVPKCDQPSLDQLQPITVLSQLYRWWARVICHQLLCHYSRYLSADLTGLLQGRGSLDAAMLQQYWIERAHFQHEHVSGLCLDLVKCFNTVHRDRVRRLLLHVGIPCAIVQQWFESIQVMTRMWTHQGFCEPPYATSTGAPEGDSFSVICMIMLDLLLRPLMPCCPRTQITLPGPLAVLWNIATSCTGVQIDWLKTWIWGTDPHMTQMLEQILCQLVPNTRVAIKANAKDLGAPMLYSGLPVLATVQKRLDKAKNRLTRLKHMKMPLPSRVTMVLGGVYPVAFYAIALQPLGVSHLNSLRGACADSLFGVAPSRNSAIALLATPRFLDPVGYVVSVVLRTVRRFLLLLAPQDQLLFYDMAATHSGRSQTCKGPASILKYWLMKLWWSFDRTGAIDVGNPAKLNLLTTSPALLTKWIRRAWEEEVFQFHCNRAPLRHMRYDFALTRQVVAKFPKKQQPSLIQELSGAFQTEAQKSLWASDTDGLCRFCQLPDSREHRLYDCPATQDTRAPYQEALLALRDEGSLCHEMPAIAADPDSLMLQQINQCHPEAIGMPHVHSQLQRLHGLGVRVGIYTDGSMQQGNFANCRFAAYALILDVSLDDADRLRTISRWKQHQIVPTNFVPLTFARTIGEQTIHRSELFAIVRACELTPCADIHSDSQSALLVAAKCQEARSLSTLVSLQDFDLVQRLWIAVHSGDHVFHKVKSHLKPSPDMPDWIAFHAFGNQAADDLAITTCHNLCPEIVSLATTLFARQQQEVAMLQRVYQLHLELHVARAKLDQASENTQAAAVALQRGPTPVQVLQQRTVTDRWVPTPTRLDNTPKAAWGQALTAQLLLWMHAVHWPTPEALPSDDPGISCYELCYSFMMHSQYVMPLKRVRTDGTEFLQPVQTSSDLERFGATFHELVHSFQGWITQTCKLLGADPWPLQYKGWCRSLYRMGHSQHHSGFKVRPVVPCQQEVVDTMTRYVRANSDFAVLPALTVRPLTPEMITQLEPPWSLLLRRATAAIALTKKRRGDGQQELVFRWRFLSGCFIFTADSPDSTSRVRASLHMRKGMISKGLNEIWFFSDLENDAPHFTQDENLNSVRLPQQNATQIDDLYRRRRSSHKVNFQWRVRLKLSGTSHQQVESLALKHQMEVRNVAGGPTKKKAQLVVQTHWEIRTRRLIHEKFRRSTEMLWDEAKKTRS